MRKLRSDDPNAQYDAVAYFEHWASEKNRSLPADLKRSDIEAYLESWGGNSDKAALLLGRIGHRESISLLKEKKAEAEQITRKADVMDDRTDLAPKVRLACLKALLRLKDNEARKEVVSLLASTDVESHVKGIECVAYGNDETLIPNLLPLLDDGRDAVNIAPSGASYFIRVCDLAADVLRNYYHIELESQKSTRYSDRDLEVLQKRGLRKGSRKGSVL